MAAASEKIETRPECEWLVVVVVVVVASVVVR